MSTTTTRWRFAPPLGISLALLLAACGAKGSDATAPVQQSSQTQTAAAPVGPASTPVVSAAVQAHKAAPDRAHTGAADTTAPGGKPHEPAARASAQTQQEPPSVSKGVPKSTGRAGAEPKGLSAIDDPRQAQADAAIAAAKAGATDVGVTKDSIKLGTVSMHGASMANLLVTPMINGIRATIGAINDRGGVLGRRLSLVDCDDGPGEVSRSKACIKKMVVQDGIFSLVGYSTWATGSVHDDLRQYRLPAVGTWAYSNTEWEDPYMFPTHMSMIHEAMAGAYWVKDVIKPRTYGLVCLTSPEMQLACAEVSKVLDASGAKLVKKLDVAISETSMSPYVLAMRAANPDHIVHYLINPATIIKFFAEAAQQGYYPPKGISGNHAATEVLGSVFGKWPAGRYWTNTTYKLWGAEFMATMNKYARANRGINHHVVQADYTGVLFFERAARAVGPNLTRERMMAQLSNGSVYEADASLDQRFSYTTSERRGGDWNRNYGQGREFMYKYENTNTVSSPDGSPNGLQPDPDQFVIYAR